MSKKNLNPNNRFDVQYARDRGIDLGSPINIVPPQDQGSQVENQGSQSEDGGQSEDEQNGGGSSDEDTEGYSKEDIEAMSSDELNELIDRYELDVSKTLKKADRAAAIIEIVFEEE